MHSSRTLFRAAPALCFVAACGDAGTRGAGGGTSGKHALAFQKVSLEGDERWKPLLLSKPTAAMQTTNIK